MGLFKPNARGLGEIERAVMNVMVDVRSKTEIGETLGLTGDQVGGALERLRNRGLAMHWKFSGRWSLTHAGKRVVR